MLFKRPADGVLEGTHVSVYQNFYFTSDLHFWHKNVIEFCKRPWKTPEEMNAGLIERWNATVGDKDIVYILGDMFFCGTNKAKDIMKQLRGDKVLVRGNHDWGVIKPHRAEEFGFLNVIDHSEVEIYGVKCLMNHFPYQGDHTEDIRYLDKRPIDNGDWLLHGHVHSAWKHQDRMINVGVDVWDWKPVNANEIFEIIEEQDGPFGYF